MKTVLTALFGSAAIASGSIVHFFENDHITLRVTVDNHIVIDDIQGFDHPVHGVKMKLEVVETAPGVRLNSVYYRANHGDITGSDWLWAGSSSKIKSFDLDTDDFNNSISPDPNPFGGVQSNPAYRPWLFSGEGRGSYNFSDNRILQQDLNAENTWFDENVDGGDQWFLYHDEFRTGSGSIGEWTFDKLPMSVVYCKEQGSTVKYFTLGNFTEIYDFDEGEPPAEDPITEVAPFDFKYSKPSAHTHHFKVVDGHEWILEASTNFRDWAPVDSPHTSYSNGDGTSTYVYTRQDKIKEFFRFVITSVQGDVDLLDVARSSVLNAIAESHWSPEESQDVFIDYGSSSMFTRNPNNILNGKEGLTALVAWNSRTNGKQLGGFAITPQHVVSTQHAAYLPGDVVFFVTADNQLVQRTVTHTKGTGFDSLTTDYVMCLLDSPLPDTIKPLEIMPADSAKYFNGSNPTFYYSLSNRLTNVWVDQNEKVIVGEFKSINWRSLDDPSPDAYTDQDKSEWNIMTGFTGSEVAEAWKKDAAAGDSGSVPMLMVGDKLVATGLYSDETSGHWYGQLDVNNDLKRLIEDVDAKAGISTGYTPTEADLNGFVTYE
jgi:hypothetical protein